MNLISDITLIQQIIAICKAQNLKHIVISPGSRNAPLILSFSNDSFFKCYSIVDERCAAFFAMGIAQQTKKPVAIVCTSGSALLNYYPAISEAFYSDIPLVVFSADRPKEFIDIGDGQTIRQEHVFKNHICFEANLKNAKEYTKTLFQENELLVKEAICVSKNEQGPVHVNIPLYEPLYNTTQKDIETLPILENTTIIDNFEIENSFYELWNSCSKKIILVGVLPPNDIEKEVLDNLLSDPSILLLTETTSNLHHNKLIPNIDMLVAELSDEEKIALQPQLLLTFGGLIVSKKIKTFLRAFQPQKHIHVSDKTAYDTFGCLTTHYKVKPNTFLTKLVITKSLITSKYQEYWLNFHKDLKAGHDRYISEIPYSDFTIFHQIIKRLKKPLHLQLSNSSTIRYTQLFQLPKVVEVFCNRGTSGIDGSTSTAIGAATIQNKQTLLITGDLSFFYDSNALWNNYIPNDFKIIVINNSGGGIFRILPGDKEANYFETFLETAHGLKANCLAKMYSFEYLEGKERNFEEQLDLFFKIKNKCILEIHTHRRINDVILLKYFKKIRQ